ncbi:hypothetical protein [Streptomyces sp. NRRL S-350]|uniref:hypothetical protein n=1 Tax=Streptomyces sp. NRRL S-350 TaxID=1463902 RepID=UPI00068C8E99|nr:hypothetical protein [Streptomyces sp. NRRL S-350]
MTTATALSAAAGTAPRPAARTAVRRARPEEAPALARLLADAFADDALMLWAFPDPDHRARVLPAFFRVHVEQCLAHQGVMVAHEDAPYGRLLGALLFLPPGVWEDPGRDDGAAARALAEAVDAGQHGDCARRLAAITDLQARRHPRHRPHYYLAFAGVRSQARTAGAGEAMLDAVLAEVDAAGQAAYAETSSEGGAHLCATHGFTRFGEAIALPGGGPRLAPVWRGPR